MITVPNAPRPENFPLGSPESRAAARSMLDARKRHGKEYHFSVVYVGFPDCEVEYVVCETGVVEKIGNEPSLEQFLAHPVCQNTDYSDLQGATPARTSTPANSAGERQAQRSSNAEQASAVPAEKPIFDPLAAVRRSRFFG